MQDGPSGSNNPEGSDTGPGRDVARDSFTGVSVRSRNANANSHAQNRAHGEAGANARDVLSNNQYYVLMDLD